LKNPFLFTLILLILFSTPDASARLLVAVTVPAQAWLVNQIAGDYVDVLTMIPPGHVAESAQPGPRNLSRFQHADIHLTVGHPDFSFETRYIKPYLNKNESILMLSMYDIAAQISPAYPLKGTDPHLWTSPLIMMATAVAVEQNLARMEPENADVYSKNLKGLLENITRLDDQIRKLVEKRISRILLVYHPAWGHFCHDFELQQLAIEDEGKAPGAGSLSALFAMLEKESIDYIISAPGSDKRIAAMIAEQFDMQLILVNPMDPDWMGMMLTMIDALEKDSD
jgi:zinc transport system substrate-binding protein